MDSAENKDSSATPQAGPFTVEQSPYTGKWIVCPGPTVPCFGWGEEGEIKHQCKVLNAAYASGRSSRDAEISALQTEVRWYRKGLETLRDIVQDIHGHSSDEEKVDSLCMWADRLANEILSPTEATADNGVNPGGEGKA